MIREGVRGVQDEGARSQNPGVRRTWVGQAPTGSRILAPDSFSLDRHPWRLSTGRRRIAAELLKGLAVEFHNESVGGLMGRLIDVPAWTDEEKFDSQTLGLFIKRGLASGDRIIGRPMHDMATG